MGQRLALLPLTSTPARSPAVLRWLHRLRQVIQHIHRLVHPPPLMLSVREDFLPRRPEAHGTIADGERRRRCQTPRREIEQHFAPPLGRLPHPVLNS
jgi:hypothetical protein